MGKKRDLGDFDCYMVIDARRAGLTIPNTAELRFSHATVAQVYTD